MDQLSDKSVRRLDSIKAAHRMERTKSSTSMEDYLEIISELVDLKGYATMQDVSRYMNVSAPSVTKMLKRLDGNGFLEYERYHGINLTAKGVQVADEIRQKHSTLVEFFGMLGVEYETASQDAEGIEHHMNPETTRQLGRFVSFLKSNPDVIKRFSDP